MHLLPTALIVSHAVNANNFMHVLHAPQRPPLQAGKPYNRPQNLTVPAQASPCNQAKPISLSILAPYRANCSRPATPRPHASTGSPPRGTVTAPLQAPGPVDDGGGATRATLAVSGATATHKLLMTSRSCSSRWRKDSTAPDWRMGSARKSTDSCSPGWSGEGRGQGRWLFRQVDFSSMLQMIPCAHTEARGGFLVDWTPSNWH